MRQKTNFTLYIFFKIYTNIVSELFNNFPHDVHHETSQFSQSFVISTGFCVQHHLPSETSLVSLPKIQFHLPLQKTHMYFLHTFLTIVSPEHRSPSNMFYFSIHLLLSPQIYLNSTGTVLLLLFCPVLQYHQTLKQNQNSLGIKKM